MIKPLTSLRFLFALMVFCHHISEFMADSALFYSWFYEGFIGVSFFFILSGFILTYNYKRKLLVKKTTKKEFWVARVARVYPLHFVTMLLSIPIGINYATELPKWLNLLFQLTLTQSFIPVTSTFYSFNAVAWSISNEAFFYFLFPFLIAAFYKSKKLLTLAAASVVIVPLTAMISSTTNAEWLLKINPVFRLADFFIGIMLYEVYERYKHLITAKKGTILELLSVALILVFFGLHDYAPLEFRFSFYYWLPMAFLIFSFAFQKGLLSKILSFKVFFILGEISFAFYMIHQLVLKYAIYLAKNYLPVIHDRKYILLLACLFISIAGSFLLHYSVEKPLNLKLKQLLSSRSIPTTTSIKFKRELIEKSI